MLDHRSAFGPFLLDHARRSLTRYKQPIAINNHGYIILATLLEAQGEPVSKQTLMERTWPNILVEEGNLTVLISTLRRQLGGEADDLLVTVPRVGYQLVGYLPQMAIRLHHSHGCICKSWEDGRGTSSSPQAART